MESLIESVKGEGKGKSKRRPPPRKVPRKRKITTRTKGLTADPWGAPAAKN
jgi:hypothetical protein